MFNFDKKRGVFSLLFLLLMVLVLLSSASLGLAQTTNNGFTAESVTAVSTFTGTEKDVAAARSSEGLDVSELETVSIIVTFDETLTAQDLEAVSAGELVYEYKNAFRGASLVMSGSRVDDVAELSGVTGVYLDELQQGINALTQEDPNRMGMLIVQQIAEQLLPHLSDGELELNDTILVEMGRDYSSDSLMSLLNS